MITPWPNEREVQGSFFDKSITKEQLKKLIPPKATIVSLKQTHSSNVFFIDEKNKEQSLEGDGLVTVYPEIALTIHTADCLPLLAFENQVIGACHGGWRGVSQGILEVWVAKMKMAGAKIENLKVAIGPAIGPCHFEVGRDVAMELTRGIPEKLLKGIKLPHSDPKKEFIDLRELARFKLLKIGVLNQNIFVCPDCTYCNPAKYFSYRRQNAEKGLRLEALIVKPLR